MYQRILFPTDGSPISEKAMGQALELARLTRATLVVMSVTEPFPYSAISEMQPVPPQAFLDAQSELARSRVKAVLEAAAKAGVPGEGVTVEAVYPWEAILRTAEEQRCDAIVMASHGRRGVAAVLLGSETTKVLTHGKLPVLVVR